MEPEAGGALVEARAVSRSYRLGAAEVPAVRGITLSLRRGEFTALQGPSGSGKTTLLNLFGLLDRPDTGRVLIEGRDVSAWDEEGRSDLRRDRFGFIFQSFNLLPVLTAEENVAYPIGLRGASRRERTERARELLVAVGLEGKRAVRPDLLSGGQRQRVAIARALANKPAVVFADEPTASLDSRTAEEILDLMLALNEDRGAAFLFATHDARVVARARRVVTLHDGTIARDTAA